MLSLEQGGEADVVPLPPMLSLPCDLEPQTPAPEAGVNLMCDCAELPLRCPRQVRSGIRDGNTRNNSPALPCVLQMSLGLVDFKPVFNDELRDLRPQHFLRA